MGNVSTTTGLTEEMLDEYRQLSYLTRGEIITIYRKFRSYKSVEDFEHDNLQRIPYENVEELFPNLKFNPFRDRLCKVFSSRRDGCLSFEDMLDLCSVFSEKCPDRIKALWAFRVYDFDDDMQVGKGDIFQMIDRLTQSSAFENTIDDKDKNHIAQTLLNEMDLQHTGSMGQLEFQHAVGKMPEFSP